MPLSDTAAGFVIQNCRLADNLGLVDLLIENGTISVVGDISSDWDHQVLDAGGRIVLPGLVEAHTHLDKTMTLASNEEGTLQGAIRLWKGCRPHLTREDYIQRAGRALRASVANGVTAMRTHVDLGETAGLLALESMLEVREAFRRICDLQIVAFGHPGKSPGETALMREAISLGADAIGGAPWLADDPEAAIAAAFDLAAQTGRPLDFHVDETVEPGVCTLGTIAEQTIAHGMQGRVVAGHCCSLASMPTENAKGVIDKVAEAQISVVTLPACNLMLQGRGMRPSPRGLTPVRELIEAGVNVAAGADNVRDPFNPLGLYDPLFTAALLVHAAQMTTQEELSGALDIVTRNAQKALGLPVTRIVNGAPADLVIFDAYTTGELMSELPYTWLVMKRGEPVVQTETNRAWMIHPEEIERHDG